MRALIQRVSRASVTINGILKSEISKGLLILLGIEEEDNQDDVAWLCTKIANLRIFDDQNGMMNLSALDVQAEIMSISQFTLLAKTKKGNRPSYIKAAKQEIAIPLYESFNQAMENCLGKKINTGEFGAYMQVSLLNDGPVTILIDTKDKE